VVTTAVPGVPVKIDWDRIGILLSSNSPSSVLVLIGEALTHLINEVRGEIEVRLPQSRQR
jgi:hypothetical protein